MRFESKFSEIVTNCTRPTYFPSHFEIFVFFDVISLLLIAGILVYELNLFDDYRLLEKQPSFN